MFQVVYKIQRGFLKPLETPLDMPLTHESQKIILNVVYNVCTAVLVRQFETHT